MWNEKLESLSQAELIKLQESKLQNLLARLYAQVPFYKEALSKSGFDPSKRVTLADLKHLPLTTKKDFHNQYPLGLLSVERSQIKRFHASSGTKGRSTLVAYTANDLNAWAELCARSLYAAGARPQDILHNSYGYGLFTGGLGIHYGAELLGATVVPASGGKTTQQIKLLQDLGAGVLCATPSYALNIANSLSELGLSKGDLQLRIGIFGAEPWTELLRERIESQLDLKAVDIYGLSEIMGPGVSVECIEARSGLHIWEDHFIAEIVDPQTGEPLAEGQEGELVITTLTKEALPVLRYRTGDLTSLTKEPCLCGRTMARMTRVKARLDDMLIVRGVNVYPSEIENILLRMSEVAPHYQLVLEREKSLDELSVKVEINEELFPDNLGSEEEKSKVQMLSEKIKGALKDHLGLSIAVELLPSRSIPRSEGKSCRLLDLRD